MDPHSTTSFVQSLANSSPYWGPFLIAFAMVLAAVKYVIDKMLKVIVSNGLTKAVEGLKNGVDQMPTRVGEAVALKILEYQVQGKVGPPIIVHQHDERGEKTRLHRAPEES